MYFLFVRSLNKKKEIVQWDRAVLINRNSTIRTSLEKEQTQLNNKNRKAIVYRGKNII